MAWARRARRAGETPAVSVVIPTLDGEPEFSAVMEALDGVGYEGFLTFEYFHPYLHYPEALIYQTSDSLDRLLGRV